MLEKMGVRKLVWLLLMLILISLGNWCCEGCWKEERDALLRIRQVFNYTKGYWVDGTDCCQWRRVKCNTTTGRVAELYLRGITRSSENFMELNFSDFQAFEDLRSLDLRFNHIMGCAGSSMLKNLRFLYLAYNFLNDTSTLPCLNGLSSLLTLSLSRNQLTGKSAYNNTKLPWPENLEQLYLDGNDFKNDILSFFTELHHLKLIDLSDNHLEGSLNISGLNALSKLKTLIIERTNITNLSVLKGSSWPTSLEDLQLGGNNFNNDLVSSFGNLQNLRSLDLSENNLEGLLDITGLNALSKLKTLVIKQNNITNLSVREGFSWPTSLEDLQLGGNNFSNDIVSSLSNLENLKSLDLSRNNLKGLLDINGLNTLSKLENLDLSYNNIVSLRAPQGIKTLSSIKDLNLDGNNIDGSMLKESLRAFSSIRRLSFEDNDFNGTIVAKDFCDLDNLEELRLYSSNIGSVFFKSIGALAFLKVLSISNCDINDTLPNADWSKLRKLEELDLSKNEFKGPLPSSFSNMTSLRKLELYYNNFTGNIAPTLASLTSLEYLDFEENNFEVPASFSSLANHSYITFVYGSGNKVMPDPKSTTQPWIPKFQLQGFSLSSIIESDFVPFPHFLLYQYNLSWLEFTNWKFGRELPNWLLENNTRMTYLVLSNCSFIGHFQLPSHSNIQEIDVSNNFITSIIISNNSSLISPNLPNLYMFEDKIFGSSLRTLDISSNNFGGNIPRGIVNSTLLWELYMDNNHFEGSIPREFNELKYLEYLDLSRNSLSGSIPSFVNTSIKYIHMSNNRFKSFSRRMLNEQSSLVLLDLGYNEITSNLQDLIGNYTKLNILLLKGNNFVGPIPKQLCQLVDLTMVDLSHNNLSGPIPKCLGEIHFNAGDTTLINSIVEGETNAYDRIYATLTVPAAADFTTKANAYTYVSKALLYMTGIDLSHNKLDGKIPYELGNLTKIRAVNMSHNYLSGEIPMTFSNLKQIESLDLSYNNLSGVIPPQLIELTTLEVFSVAYNNISGKTPELKNQFTTFEESSYEGNPFLCGPPLRKTCIGDPSYPRPVALNGEGDNDNFLDMQVFYVTFWVAYAMILLVMAAVLYINPYWRRAWFYFIEFVITNCYYFFVDFFYKLSTITNM